MTPARLPPHPAPTRARRAPRRRTSTAADLPRALHRAAARAADAAAEHLTRVAANRIAAREAASSVARLHRVITRPTRDLELAADLAEDLAARAARFLGHAAAEKLRLMATARRPSKRRAAARAALVLAVVGAEGRP